MDGTGSKIYKTYLAAADDYPEAEIKYPEGLYVKNTPLEIQGWAKGKNFVQYTLEYGMDKFPSPACATRQY